MAFLIFYSFSGFFKSLDSGSVVYKLAITEGDESGFTAFILLTSQAAKPLGAPIHALRLDVEVNGETEGAAGALIRQAANKLAEFLEFKGMTVETGALLTEGLKEAMGLYLISGQTTMEEINNFVDKVVGVNK